MPSYTSDIFSLHLSPSPPPPLFPSPPPLPSPPLPLIPHLSIYMFMRLYVVHVDVQFGKSLHSVRCSLWFSGSRSCSVRKAPSSAILVNDFNYILLVENASESDR